MCSKQSLRDSLAQPELLISDFAKFDHPASLHVAFQALSDFREQNGRLPRPRNSQDSEAVVQAAQRLASEGQDIDVKLVRELAAQAAGDLSPMVAVIGAFVAQEVLKACSGKFHPLHQYLYFDSLESLPTDAATLLTESECAPQGGRYDGQIAVFGKTFQQKIQNNRQFLVGSGAIGCEMLKNWAMMGVGTGERGSITVTDLDTIEKSNLNRQFLFRPADLGKFKAEAATNAVIGMNPGLDTSVRTKLQLERTAKTSLATTSSTISTA